MTKEEKAAYMKAYHATHRAEHRAAHKRWKANNPNSIRAKRRRNRLEADPLKMSAQRAVRNAVYRRTLKRSDFCQLCLGTVKIEAHHPDYTKKLDVIWLCNACHRGIEGRV